MLNIIWGVIALLLGALGSVTWYQVKRNNERLDTFSDENSKLAGIYQDKLNKEVQRIYDKYDAEMEELRTNYTQQFNLVHANISQTKDAIIDRINQLDVKMAEKFVTKDDCRDVQRRINGR